MNQPTQTMLGISSTYAIAYGPPTPVGVRQFPRWHHRNQSGTVGLAAGILAPMWSDYRISTQARKRWGPATGLVVPLLHPEVEVYAAPGDG